MRSSIEQDQEHLLAELSGDDEDQFLQEKRQTDKRQVIFSLACHFLAGAVVSLAFFLVFDGLRNGEGNTKPTFRYWEPSSTCGNTPEDAVAHGCIYDEVLLHWIPRECSNPELINEFVHVWPWRFWTDRTATEEITLDEVRQGTQLDKWVTFGLHRWHCVATWKILSSAAALGTTVPAFALDWNHTVHCSDHVLMNKHGSDNPFAVNSHLDIEYTPCVPLARDRTMRKGAHAW